MNKIIQIFFLLVIFSSTLISADIFSLNPVSGDEFVLTSDRYIEGFFFCNPSTCAEMGYTCGTWNDGCGISLACGTCGAGYTCTAGTCVAIVTPPPNGGGGGGVITPTYNIVVSPTEFNINMKINTNVKEIVTVTSLEDSTITVGVTQSNLTNMVMLENTYLTIPAKQTVQLDVIFVAPEKPGIYTGKIFIGGKTILVTLNVKTELLLFDSNIVVLNENYEVRQGEQLKTLVTLIPLGDPTRLDVTLNFLIKDYANRIYLTQSETLLVEKQVQLKRNFDTGILPLGDYVVGLELVYPDGVAPSSAHFKVIEKPVSTILGKIILFLIILILLIAIIIIIILIVRKIKEKRQTNQT
ncbi:MAG TPA: hypothetical protein VMV95_02400 [Bacillota bacterium]|nr:hypothetical protein [Bacillota bacterium]